MTTLINKRVMKNIVNKMVCKLQIFHFLIQFNNSNSNKNTKTMIMNNKKYINNKDLLELYNIKKREPYPKVKQKLLKLHNSINNKIINKILQILKCKNLCFNNCHNKYHINSNLLK